MCKVKIQKKKTRKKCHVSKKSQTMSWGEDSDWFTIIQRDQFIQNNNKHTGYTDSNHK